MTSSNLPEALAHLSALDPGLAGIHQRFGPPPLWARQPGFATLVHIILEQQVSLASARAAFERLRVAASPLTPSRLLELDGATLRAAGVSRQKARYARLLAEAMISGELDLEALDRLGDAAARSALLQVPGIGPWTADIYLLMALGRPDVWPSGDLALAVSVQRLRGLRERPAPGEMDQLAEPWKPWRAVAARLLWHDYLSRRRA